MRILVLGAGALGSYYGGRLAEGGADVTFLVRGRRKAELDANGLIVKSPFGDIALKPATIAAGERAAPFDIVLLSCKAYDLDAAIAAIAPFMGPDSGVVTLLNGMVHLDTLAAALGRERVMGGVGQISATLGSDGTVRHMSDGDTLIFGELTGAASPRAQAFAAAFAHTKAKAVLAPDIVQAMWEKFVMLAALAATTTLTRATVGEIVAVPGGEGFTLAALAECTAVAAAEGHAPSPAALTMFRGMLTARGSAFAASTMRDLAAGRRTEGDHIVGDLVRRAHRHGVAVAILDVALLNLAVHEAKLARG
jgi:2-dehydropantoate 2-reductase